MQKTHKHAELIKQWADGAEIECYCRSVDKWHYHSNPMWIPSLEYRVKPKPKWTPKYKLEVYEYRNIHPKPVFEENNLSDDVRRYWVLTKFVEEFEQDWDNQRYELLIENNWNNFTVVDCLFSCRTLGTIRMSKECAEKLCKMLNNREIEL